MKKGSRPLPPSLLSYPPLYKLVWLYIEANPGPLQVADAAAGLGHAFNAVAVILRQLRAAGLVVTITPGALVPGKGRAAGAYRVAKGPELDAVPPYKKGA